jgi:NAD(P)H-dependent FMN reductase
MSATRIIGLSGSLRAASFNTGALRAAAELMPEGAELILKTIHGIPLYDGDVEERDGIPAAVSELGKAIAEADGLIIASPEYNNSVPGPLKNAIDWLSRIDDIPQPVFAGKPVAVIGASPGGFGTLLGQNAWLPVLRTLETRVWFGGRLLISKAAAVTDSTGLLTDAAAKEKLRAFLEGFSAFAREPGV